MTNFDKKLIGQNFSKAAPNYDETAVIQKTAAEKLCDLIVEKKLLKSPAEEHFQEKRKVLDLGSGTSFIAKTLLQKFPPNILHNLEFFELDLSHEMLKKWSESPKNLYKSNHKIQADFEKIPCKQNNFDLIVSSFSLQWANDFDQLFSRIHQLLKRDGNLALCLPLNDSLRELKQASVASKCHFDFTDLPTVDSLNSAIKKSFSNAFHLENKTLKQKFDDGVSAIKFLKTIGASYQRKNKNYYITTKQLKAFNALCTNSTDSNFEISWDLAFITAQK